MNTRPAQMFVNAEIRPQDAALVNWEARPSQFKMYQHGKQLQLSPGIRQETTANPKGTLTLQQMDRFLAEIYGLMQQTYLSEENLASRLFFHRPVPSGGALFPCEYYIVVGSGQQVPAGVYHYDVAHHALDILRQGDYLEAICSCLAHPGSVYPDFVVALSCFFWKDGFKYGSFSYRLQGLDLGTVITQSIEVLKSHSWQATVHYQFLDRRVDALLGLDVLHESIYALLTLSHELQQSRNTEKITSTPSTLPEDLSSPDSLPVADALESIEYWPLPAAIHSAALFEARERFCALDTLDGIIPPPSLLSYPLPPIEENVDLLAKLSKRHSASGPFLPLPLTVYQLAFLLKASARGYHNDLRRWSPKLQHTLLYCAVNRVKDIASGIYYYHPTNHTLELVWAGDVGEKLQSFSRDPRRNMRCVSVCIFPVGHFEVGFQALGDRWYRIQNMEAGIAVQRCYLGAAMLELGCRASLGFVEQRTHALLCLPEQWRALIQILIAPEAYSPASYKQSLFL